MRATDGGGGRNDQFRIWILRYLPSFGRIFNIKIKIARSKNEEVVRVVEKIKKAGVKVLREGK